MLREADLAEDAESGYHRLLLQLNHEVLWWPISQVRRGVMCFSSWKPNCLSLYLYSSFVIDIGVII